LGIVTAIDNWSVLRLLSGDDQDDRDLTRRVAAFPDIRIAEYLNISKASGLSDRRWSRIITGKIPVEKRTRYFAFSQRYSGETP
jgi:hypothetical protein